MGRLLLSCLGLAASLSLGCSGDSGAASSGGDGGESASSSSSSAASSSSSTGTGGAVPFPAPHAPLPILQDTGGLLVTAPKVVEVFFSNDDSDSVAQINDFVPKLGASQYWQSMVAEYGIGAYTASTVDLPMPLTGTLDDTDIQSWIVDQIENGGVLPQPDDQTIYALFFPAGTGFTIDGSRSCIDYYGYHSSTKLDADHGGGDVIYAPLARCPSVQGYSEIQLVTALTSHELAEATTDPLYYTNPAYQSVDAPSAAIGSSSSAAGWRISAAGRARSRSRRRRSGTRSSAPGRTQPPRRATTRARRATRRRRTSTPLLRSPITTS